MRCPSCASENFDTAAFCSLCFWPLTAGADPVAEVVPLVVDAAAAEPMAAAATAAAGPTMPDYETPWQPPDGGYAEVMGTAAMEATPVSGHAAAGEASSRSFDSDTYVSGMFVENQLKAESRPVRRRFEIPFIGMPFSWGMLRLVLIMLALALPIAIWGLSGGFKSQQEGRSARLPVPPGSTLVTVERGITRGPLGELSEERQQLYATRIFLVPLSEEAAESYYRSGAGSLELAKQGWTGGVSRGISQYDGRWSRVKDLGWVPSRRGPGRVEESQELMIEMVDRGPALPEAAKRLVQPGTNCIVLITCTGAGLEKLEYPER